MERKSVVVVGSLNYDYILRTSRLPQRGETLVADSVDFCCGGKAPIKPRNARNWD
jgi:ribokinase